MKKVPKERSLSFLRLELVAEWDAAIWIMTVEKALVLRNNRMRFKFYTGAEIEFTL